MLRWLATAVIVLLLALAVFVPWTSLGRRGAEAAVREEAPTATLAVGDRLPNFTLIDLEGEAFQMADFRGKRVLLTFERSVDW